MKVRLIVEYDYMGDETTPEAIAAAEAEAWKEGNVGVVDILGCGDDLVLSVYDNSAPLYTVTIKGT